MERGEWRARAARPPTGIDAVELLVATKGIMDGATRVAKGAAPAGARENPRGHNVVARFCPVVDKNDKSAVCVEGARTEVRDPRDPREPQSARQGPFGRAILGSCQHINVVLPSDLAYPICTHHGVSACVIARVRDCVRKY